MISDPRPTLARIGGRAGYSATPLPRKLGLKDGQRSAFVGLPDGLDHLARAAGFAECICVADWRAFTAASLDYVHMFTQSRADLAAALPRLRQAIHPAGMIWISWPKRASRMPTDVTEDVVRDLALADVLVDIKVCAVDETWSGLKLVIRKELRAGQAPGQGGKDRQ